ncbi:MAG: DUF1840 domain-containing protein [Gammaproteobacteria bacterium]|nr:DUF1840 domain-containing protein [Gammaproteobacteria bacterium]
MLVTFKSKSYANITMFGDIAQRMLKLMDFGCKIPGGIVASDVPAALENLQLGLQSIPKEIDTSHDTDDDQPAIGLHTRALPLVELLRAAMSADNDVRWE